jgi:tetratricopeptide (TPR) repeat protein
MVKLWKLLLFAPMIFSIVLGQAAAQDRDLCSQRDGARSIDACSRLIENGQLAGKDLATIYALRATIYRINRQYDQAIADITHAIALLKDTASNQILSAAYVMRGSIFSLKGDLQNAIDDYRNAVTLDSDNIQAAEALAQAQAAISSPPPAQRGQGGPKDHPDQSAASPNDTNPYASLVACCIAYCRLIKCNSPPLPKACSSEVFALYKGMSYDDQKKNYLAGARAYFGRRISIPACM